jgi:hypothetical protein
MSQNIHNKAMQSDSAPCHALCVPHKDAPGCYAVDGGVMCRSDSGVARLEQRHQYAYKQDGVHR